MLYLDEKDLLPHVDAWDQTISVIERACACLAAGDFAQPVKPYLRYRDRANRIIAMPAFVGGEFDAAGIKWIASFPKNIERGVPRAHAIVILNEASTGVPTCIVSGALLSVLRTASVSGAVLRPWAAKRKEPIRVGMTGFGPIGRYHVRMITKLLGDRVSEIAVHDLRSPTEEDVAEHAFGRPVRVVKSWQEAYEGADLFVTCTASKDRYIDLPPKRGSLHLNVSLRDYEASTFPFFEGAIVVDDWDEIAREDTDIEVYQKTHGLGREGTRSLAEVVTDGLPLEARSDGVVMFNPMGMAVFDVALGAHYLERARSEGFGREL